MLVHTIWAVLPPVITIILALLTKEVYMSLIVGVFAGAFMYSGFNILGAVDTLFAVMNDRIGGNVYILIFLVLLGIFVAIINKSGASQAYGEWAAKKIKGKRMAMFVTMLLGIIIFIDDYFNCLTVGTVMRPVTDKFNISRAKLAYIIDSTAAPICIIAPVSSWAAAVTSSLPDGSNIDGFALFLHTIPLNMYAWFTIFFVLFIIWSNKDYSRMKAFEHQSEVVIPREYQGDTTARPVGNGRIIDLVLPLLVLIASCTFGMMYTGHILDPGVTIQQSFADCESARGLVIGSFIALVFTFLLYIPRKVLKFEDFCSCYTLGFKAMVPSMLILALAWSLSGICGSDYLDLGGYVGNVLSDNTTAAMFMPVVFYVVSLGLAFATGTSWGTFGILIPIVVAVIGETDPNLLTFTVAAILAGAVGGDHVSPISDTTIMSSAGAQCHHLDHVQTQLPYAMTVMACCIVGYFVGGITFNAWYGLAAGVAALVCVLGVLYKTRMG